MLNFARARAIGVVLALVASAGIAGCGSDSDNGDDVPGDDQPGSQSYRRVDLVSDEVGVADRVDADLVNAWGIAYGPDTAFWIANAGTESTSIYNGDGKRVLPGISLGGEVTGVVYNPSAGLVLSVGLQSSPAAFVFATTSGTLIAWSDKVAPSTGVLAYDGSSREAAYTGLALATNRFGQTRLYAANFASGQVDVFDDTFALMLPSNVEWFVDPALPAGYVPFGIQAIGDTIYVAYALQDEKDSHEEVIGAGLGIVSAFTPDGEFVRRVMTSGELNAPWAIARAPVRFGEHSGDLLIGNFGDGRITALDSEDRVVGQLEQNGEPIAIEGLWGITFGNDRNAGSSSSLYFAAGPEDETHGLFGRIDLVQTPGSGGGGGGGGGYGGGTGY